MEIDPCARQAAPLDDLAPTAAVITPSIQVRLPQLRDVSNSGGEQLTNRTQAQSGEVRSPDGQAFGLVSCSADAWQTLKVQETQADRLVAHAYNEIVKRQEFGALGAHLRVLDKVVRNQCNGTTQERLSQVYLVKVAHVLEAVINRARRARPDLLLTRSVAKLWMQEIERRVEQGEFSANGAAFSIYHVGDLMNDGELAPHCASLINQVLSPVVTEYMRARPGSGEGVFGLAFCGAVRAFEVLQSDQVQRWKAPCAVDLMVEAFASNGWGEPATLRHWSNRALTMTAKYAEQHRWRLIRQVQLDPVGSVLKQRLLALTKQSKGWLDEARSLQRGVWNAQLQHYQPIGGGRITGMNRDQEDLCFAVHHYCKWVNSQSAGVRAQLQLAPVHPARPEIADTPRNERQYAQVLAPQSAPEVIEISLNEPTQGLGWKDPVAELEAIAEQGEQVRAGQASAPWRERAVHAANAWVQAGERDRRVQLRPAEREGWDAFVQIFYQLQRQLSEDPLNAERRQGYVDALQRYAIYLAGPGTSG